MRVIIELTEEESLSTAVSRQIVGKSESETQAQNMAALDGGAPSDELLASIGREATALPEASEATDIRGSGPLNGDSASNAGGPAEWMSIAMDDPDR